MVDNLYIYRRGGDKMELGKIGVPKRQRNILNKRGIFCVDDILNYLPYKYNFYNRPCFLNPEISGKSAAIIGICKSCKNTKANNVFMIKVCIEEEKTGLPLFVTWMGGIWYHEKIHDSVNKRVMVAGPITLKTFEDSGKSCYFMNTPDVFAVDNEINDALHIYPVYRKIKGISEDSMSMYIRNAVTPGNIFSSVPKEFEAAHHLMSKYEAYKNVHFPVSSESIRQAKAAITYYNLFFYMTEIEKRSNVTKTTDFVMKNTEKMEQYINSLPFPLTQSQKNAIYNTIDNSKQNKRNHILLQGDVCSGKTVVAVSLAIAMAENGYQAAIMAPTVILATQHYDGIIEVANRLGLKVCLMTSNLKKHEKNEMTRKINSHEYDIIIGTHGIISDDIQYPALGMIIIDEEHRFGVEQREKLVSKAAIGVHEISMSATPIARTVTQAFYSSDVQVCELEVPSIRKPIRTTFLSDKMVLYKYILTMIASGQQVYSVCPYVEENEDNENIISVEELYREYQTAFNGKVKIGVVTGKMKQEDADQIINDFKNKKYHILIATTIIEVGVNVPNANLIIINNPDRFGLAQLHQLRGRVGRGSQQGFCAMYLKADTPISPISKDRIDIMCRTSNGFVIAEEDLKLRGGGYVLGTKQSGFDVYLDMISKYPYIFEGVKKDIAKYLANTTM